MIRLNRLDTQKIDDPITSMEAEVTSQGNAIKRPNKLASFSAFEEGMNLDKKRPTKLESF